MDAGTILGAARMDLLQQVRCRSTQGVAVPLNRGLDTNHRDDPVESPVADPLTGLGPSKGREGHQGSFRGPKSVYEALTLPGSNLARSEAGHV